MKKKLLLMGCIVLLVATFSSIKTNIEPEEYTIETPQITPAIYMSVSRVHYSEEQVWSGTNFIIKGKVLALKEVGQRTSEGNGVGVILPYITYRVEVQDQIQGHIEGSKIDLAILNASINDQVFNLKIGKEYVFFLNKWKGPDESLFSLSDGFYGAHEFNNNSSTFRYLIDGKDHNLKFLKEKLKNKDFEKEKILY